MCAFWLHFRRLLDISDGRSGNKESFVAFFHSRHRRSYQQGEKYTHNHLIQECAVLCKKTPLDFIRVSCCSFQCVSTNGQDWNYPSSPLKRNQYWPGRQTGKEREIARSFITSGLSDSQTLLLWSPSDTATACLLLAVSQHRLRSNNKVWISSKWH